MNDSLQQPLTDRKSDCLQSVVNFPKEEMKKKTINIIRNIILYVNCAYHTFYNILI
jgi:hypothetical protein